MKGEIKAIIFDIGGVLQVDSSSRKKRNQLHSSGVHEAVAKKLKISLDQYFDAIDTAYARSLEGKISEKNLLILLSRNLKTSKEKLKKIYYDSYKRKFKINNWLLKKAIKLKEEGYKISILSDQWHLSKKAHAPKKLIENFNPVILSCDIGHRKPDPKIYNLVLKKIKLRPRNVLFIDNQIWNIVAAEKIGMNVILFRNNKDFSKKLKKFLK